jgi:hypothetical protein
MPDADSPRLKALQRKLHKLVACVMTKAAEDSAFAKELEAALTQHNAAEVSSKSPTTLKKLPVSPVTILHTKGEDGLRTELEKLTDDELRRLVRTEGLLKGHELKEISRPELMAELITGAQRRLGQGGAFLKNP